MGRSLPAEAFNDLMLELSETQRSLLADIENRLAGKLGLTRSHLFGTNGKPVNALLQQGVIFITMQLPTLKLSADWLASYLGLRPWMVEDYREYAEHAMRAPIESEFGRAILAVWQECYGHKALGTAA